MSDNPNQQAAWLLERVGFVTASQFKHLLARKKPTPAQAKAGELGEYTAARDTYLWQLVTERLTGRATEHYVNHAMQWGIDQEGFARAEFVNRMRLMVDLVGFIKHPTLMCGASPDGVINGGDGLVEFKCPTTNTHLQTIMDGMDLMHMAQLQGQMWMTGAKEVYFCSYDPRLPRGMDFFVDRIDRDQAYIDTLETEVCKFLNDINDTIATLEEKSK
jgi:hypothetical protein